MAQSEQGTAAIQARLEKMKSMKLDMTYKLDQEKLQSEAKLKQHRLEMDRQFNQQTRTESDALARAKQEEADAAAPRKPVPVPQTGSLGQGASSNAPSQAGGGGSINSQAPQPASKDTATTTSEATNDPRFRNETTTTTRTGQENRGMIRNMLSDAIGGPFSRETTSTSVSQQLVEVPNWAKGKGKEVLDLHNIYQDQPEVFAEHMAKIEGVVGPEAFKAIAEEYEQQLTTQTATRKENVNKRAQILVDTTTINGEQLPFSQAVELEKLQFSDRIAYAKGRDRLSDVSAVKGIAEAETAKFEAEANRFALKEARARSGLAEEARADQVEINENFFAWDKTRESVSRLFSPAQSDSYRNMVAADQGVNVPGRPKTGAEHKALSLTMAKLSDDASGARVTVDSAGKTTVVQALNPGSRELYYNLRLYRDGVFTLTKPLEAAKAGTGVAGAMQYLGFANAPQMTKFKETTIPEEEMRQIGFAFHGMIKDADVSDALIQQAIRQGIVVETDKGYSMPHIVTPGHVDAGQLSLIAEFWQNNTVGHVQVSGILEDTENNINQDKLEQENPDIPRRVQKEESGRNAARWLKENAPQVIPYVVDNIVMGLDHGQSQIGSLFESAARQPIVDVGNYMTGFTNELGLKELQAEGLVEQRKVREEQEADARAARPRSMEAGRQGIGTDKVPPKMRKFLDDRSERINKTNAEKRRKLERALHGN